MDHDQTKVKITKTVTGHLWTPDLNGLSIEGTVLGRAILEHRVDHAEAWTEILLGGGPQVRYLLCFASADEHVL
jgi:hypothetical protein